MQSPFLLYSGEFDARDGPATDEPWLRKMQFEGSEDFWSQARQVYYLSYPADNIGGYWRTSPFFEYLTVPKSGHFVPTDYYFASRQFVADYISNQSLQCHAASADCTVTTNMCFAMLGCNGNGTCGSNGKCVCDAGWKGADCSLSSVALTNGYMHTFSYYGPEYFSFTKSGANDSQFTLISSTEMDVYISAGADSDPTEFSHDFAVLGTKTLVLDSLDLDILTYETGYVVQTYAKNMDEAKNEYYHNTLTVQFG